MSDMKNAEMSQKTFQNHVEMSQKTFQNHAEMSQKTFQNNVEMSQKTFQKMLFVMNAIEQGWSVKKIQQSYIFTKKHENKKEIFQEDYLEKFVESNCNLPI